MLIAIIVIFILMIVGMGFAIMYAMKGGSDGVEGVAVDTTYAQNTQQMLPFKEVLAGGVVDLGGHKYRRYIDVSSVNYNLKTPKEKQMIEASFQGFLNSLQFPITIFVQTKEIDNSKMIQTLENDVEEVSEVFESLKEYGQIYIEEMKNLTITINNTKQKKKYIIVPFDDAFNMKDLTEEQKAEYSLKELDTRTAMICEALTSMGLKNDVLDHRDVVELLYSTFNKDDYSDVESMANGEYEEPIVKGATVDWNQGRYVVGNRLVLMNERERASHIIYEAQKSLRDEVLSKILSEEDEEVLEKLMLDLQNIRGVLDKDQNQEPNNKIDLEKETNNDEEV